MTIEEISFDKAQRIYSKLFNTGFLNVNIDQKLALISIICYITKALRDKGKNVNCYDVILKICKDFNEHEKKGFLKSFAVICEDFLYGCKEIPTFGIKPSEMPKTARSILNNYLPF